MDRNRFIYENSITISSSPPASPPSHQNRSIKSRTPSSYATASLGQPPTLRSPPTLLPQR